MRSLYIKLAIMAILIPIGIASKFYSGPGSNFSVNHLGGIIYVIFWILFFSIIFPSYSKYKLTIIVLVVTCCLEFAQLIQNPVLTQLRKNYFFSALFGGTFNWGDFPFYFIGAGVGWLCVVVRDRETK